MMQMSVELYAQVGEETRQASAGTDRQPAPRVVAGALVELKRSATIARGIGFEMELLSPAGGERKFPLHRSRRRRRRGVRADRRLRRSVGLTQAWQGRAGRRREDPAKTCGDRVRAQGPRITAVNTDTGAIHCEIIVNAAGHLGAPVRRAARARVPGDVVEHQYLVTEKDGAFRRAAQAARPGPQLLSEAGARRVRDRRLGEGDAAVPSPGVPFEFGQELFPQNMDRLEGFALAPPSESRCSTSSASAPDQRPDPGLGRRRADHRPASSSTTIPRLRIHRRHRRLGRRRTRARRLDCRGRSGDGPVGVRRAPLRDHSARARCTTRVHATAVLQDALSGRGATVGARRAPQPAMAGPEGPRRGVRLEVRLGAAELVAAGIDRTTEFEGKLTGSMPSAPSNGHAQGHSADRHLLVHQVRGRRGAPSRRCSAWPLTISTSRTAA